jgi:hypothetical protein
MNRYKKSTGFDTRPQRYQLEVNDEQIPASKIEVAMISYTVFEKIDEG